MSQDVQLGWPCPHITMEEPVVLSSDRRSLETRQPVAAAGLARILVNNEFYIPPGGFHTVARLKGGRSGPFHVLLGEQSLTVTGSTETATVSLPVGYRVKTDTIVKKLIPLLNDVVVENVKGHLVLTDGAALGKKASIQVSGTAAASVGFGDQRGVRGRELYPGWQLALREDTITNRYPVFKSPVKTTPNFKVTYSVPPQRCLRCGGTYIENDWRFDLTGDTVLIEEENLLQQAALKILLTRKNSNVFHRWYGTTLMTRIGSKAVGAVASLIQEDVQNALGKMQAQQTQQAKYQRVSLKERLYKVASVDVKTHVDDPTAFLVDTVVYNASGQRVNVSVVFTVPGAAALMGSNGLSLGLG